MLVSRLLALFLTLGSLALFFPIAGNIFVCLRNQRPFVNSQSSGTLANIRSTYYRIGNDTHRTHDAVDGLGTLDGVLHILQHQLGLKLDEIRLVGLNIVLKLLRGMLAGKRIGVIAIGQQQHLDIHALLQQHICSAHGSMDTSLVAIIEQHDIGRESAQ